MKMISKPEIRFCDIGDAEISYLTYEGEGPALIFLHATGFLPWLWHPIARELTDNYRVLAPYFCDHRESEPEEGGLLWYTLAEDLRAFCETLRISDPFLVGHSMGGTVMTLAGATGADFSPERMILIEPIYLPEFVYDIEISVEHHPLAAKSIKRKHLWESEEDLREYLQNKKLFENWDPEMLDLYVEYGMNRTEAGGLSLACHPRREASLFMGGAHYNPWPLLGEVTCPVLVVEGGNSENREHIDLKKASSLFPRGEYLCVEGAGHLVPMEQPKTVVKIVRDFFV